MAKLKVSSCFFNIKFYCYRCEENVNARSAEGLSEKIFAERAGEEV